MGSFYERTNGKKEFMRGLVRKAAKRLKQNHRGTTKASAALKAADSNQRQSQKQKLLEFDSARGVRNIRTQSAPTIPNKTATVHESACGVRSIRLRSAPITHK
jgi:hypothetical protein